MRIDFRFRVPPRVTPKLSFQIQAPAFPALISNPINPSLRTRRRVCSLCSRSRSFEGRERGIAVALFFPFSLLRVLQNSFVLFSIYLFLPRFVLPFLFLPRAGIPAIIPSISSPSSRRAWPAPSPPTSARASAPTRSLVPPRSSSFILVLKDHMRRCAGQILGYAKIGQTRRREESLVRRRFELIRVRCEWSEILIFSLVTPNGNPTSFLQDRKREL